MLVTPSLSPNSNGIYHQPKLGRFQIRGLANSLPLVPGADAFSHSYGLALLILQFYFGLEWLRRHVFDHSSGGFLSRSLGSEDGAGIVMHRVRDLAELMINLENVPGIVQPMKQIMGGKIESGYAELQAARLLRTSGVQFRFVDPSGVAGSDYDFLIRSPDGEEFCCDAKCKLETGSFRPGGLHNSLNEARSKNLPSGKPCSIIVKIPHDWLDKDGVMKEIYEVCNTFMMQTKRIVFIFLYSSYLKKHEEMLYHQLWGFEIRTLRPDTLGKSKSLIASPQRRLFRSPIGWRPLVRFAKAGAS